MIRLLFHRMIRLLTGKREPSLHELGAELAKCEQRNEHIRWEIWGKWND